MRSFFEKVVGIIWLVILTYGMIAAYQKYSVKLPILIEAMLPLWFLGYLGLAFGGRFAIHKLFKIKN